MAKKESLGKKIVKRLEEANLPPNSPIGNPEALAKTNEHGDTDSDGHPISRKDKKRNRAAVRTRGKNSDL